jgi:hypothetical protein
VFDHLPRDHTCGVCGQLIQGPCMSDPESGSAFHPACFAERLPEEAIVALIAALALVFAPVIVLWAA